MKSRERELYSAGYSQACATALLLFGYPPSCFRNYYETVGEYNEYNRQVREWWLSTQNPGTSEKRSYRFLRYFKAWCEDQKRRAKEDGAF